MVVGGGGEGGSKVGMRAGKGRPTGTGGGPVAATLHVTLGGLVSVLGYGGVQKAGWHG